MPIPPPRSACFRPDEYKDLTLFANRRGEVDDVYDTLDSYLRPGGPGHGRLLLRGHRGVGKSMLARKVIDRLRSQRELLIAESDCAAVAVGPEAVLRTVATALSKEAIQNARDDSLVKAAKLLGDLSDKTSVKARDVRTWTKEVKSAIAATSKLYDTLALEFGMNRVAGRSKQIEASSERAIDAHFLSTLIADFLVDCRLADQKVLVFIDNLDQACYPEKSEDVQRVTDLLRHFFALQDGVVLVTIRTEFVSRDLHKMQTHSIEVHGMDAAGLREVAKSRMDKAGSAQQADLKLAGFDGFVDILSGWTNNVWGYLTWLNDLDYSKADTRNVSSSHIQPLYDALLGANMHLYPGLREDELRTICGAFRGKPDGFCIAADLLAAGLSEDLLRRGVSYHALVPDWLLGPSCYMLPPQLHFLVP